MLNLVFSFEEKNADRIIEAFSLKDTVWQLSLSQKERYLSRLFEYFSADKSAAGVPKLLIKYMGRVSCIDISSLRYIEVYNRIVVLHTDKEEFSTYASLSLMEELLKDMSFLRVQRSYLISLRHISRVEGNRITLDTGKVIPIGKVYKREVSKRIVTKNCVI